MPVKIFTIAHKRPDFIELQLRSFQKQLQDGFEFIIFNNATFDTDKTLYNQINARCRKLGLSVIDIRADQALLNAMPPGGPYAAPTALDARGMYTSANVANAYSMCWAWREVISKENNPVCVLDSDIFFIRPIRIADILRRYQLAFVPQGRANEHGHLEYMWVGFVLADMPTLPDPSTVNWWCGKAKHNLLVDVGGQTYQYLGVHPDLKVLRVPAEPIEHFHYELLSVEGEQSVLHYRCGSNWDNKSDDFHNQKLQWLREKFGI